MIEKYMQEIQTYCIGRMSEEQRKILEVILGIVYARGVIEGMKCQTSK